MQFNSSAWVDCFDVRDVFKRRLLTGVARSLTGLALAFCFNQIVQPSAYAYDKDANGTPEFFVSKTGPTDGSADGTAAKPWPELDQVDWAQVQAANEANQPGQMHAPTSNFTGLPWTVIVEIDGGSSYMEYGTPLHITGISNNQYINYVVVRRKPNTGQVIINGAKFAAKYAGCPCMDLSDQSGTYIIGNCEFGQSGPAAGLQGIVCCNAPVGLYEGNSSYANISGVMASNNGIGMLAAGLGDLPTPIINGQRLNVNTSTTGGLGYVAGEGFHMHECVICNNWDPNFRAQCWFANSIYQVPGSSGNQTSALPNGYPQMIGMIIFDTAHPGLTDGIVYNTAQGQSSFTYYQLWDSVLGPGLWNCVNLKQTNHGVSSLGNLFINPYNAALIKYDSSQVFEVCNTASVMKNINANGQATAFIIGPESQALSQPAPIYTTSTYDRVHCCSIAGGSIQLQGTGNVANGNQNDLTGVEGNTVIVSNNQVASRFVTDPSTLSNSLSDWMATFTPARVGWPPSSADAAANQQTTDYPNTTITPPASLAACLGVTPGIGVPIPSGFAAGFNPGSSGGGSGGTPPPPPPPSPPPPPPTPPPPPPPPPPAPPPPPTHVTPPSTPPTTPRTAPPTPPSMGDHHGGMYHGNGHFGREHIFHPHPMRFKTFEK